MERKVIAQKPRPAFRDDGSTSALGYLPFNDLGQHCDSLFRFSEERDVLKKLARFGLPS